jgi:hypothetical protein
VGSYSPTMPKWRSRDSLVGIVTALRAGRPRNTGSIIGMGKRFFSSLQHPDRLLSTPSLRILEALSSRIKRPEREFVELCLHSYTYSQDVVLKKKDCFTFTFTFMPKRTENSVGIAYQNTWIRAHWTWDVSVVIIPVDKTMITRRWNRNLPFTWPQKPNLQPLVYHSPFMSNYS